MSISVCRKKGVFADEDRIQEIHLYCWWGLWRHRKKRATSVRTFLGVMIKSAVNKMIEKEAAEKAGTRRSVGDPANQITGKRATESLVDRWQGEVDQFDRAEQIEFIRRSPLRFELEYLEWYLIGRQNGDDPPNGIGSGHHRNSYWERKERAVKNLQHAFPHFLEGYGPEGDK